MSETNGSAGVRLRLERDARKQAFAGQLRKAMAERNWTIAETARRVQEHLPEGEVFKQGNLAQYRTGRALPRPRYLEALAKALGMDRDLLSDAEKINLSPSDRPIRTAQREGGDDLPAFRVQDLDEGHAWIQINQRLPWPVVLKLLQALKG